MLRRREVVFGKVRGKKVTWIEGVDCQFIEGMIENIYTNFSLH